MTYGLLNLFRSLIKQKANHVSLLISQVNVHIYSLCSYLFFCNPETYSCVNP